MNEYLTVFEPGDRVATMAIGGQARIWEVSAAGNGKSVRTAVSDRLHASFSPISTTD